MSYRALARFFFSSATFRALVEHDLRPALRESLERLDVLIRPRTSVGQAFDLAYECLRRAYRNEYFFKNEITKKLLLGRHSLETTRLLSEFAVGDTKVDVALINGSSTAYEIKTDYDDWGRLHNQVCASLTVFDQVYVVASEAAIRELRNAVPRPVGIVALTKRGHLSIARDAKSNRRNVSAEAIFKCLRMSELRSICKSLGTPIEGPNTTWESQAWATFRQLAPTMAHDLMAEAVRSRPLHRAHLAFIEAVPHSLKHLSVAKTLPVGRYSGLAARFGETF